MTHSLKKPPSNRRLRPGDCLRLSGVDWQTYLRLLRIFAERPAVRLTYDRGELEIMSPLLEHDDDSRFLCQLVVALTDELGMPLKFGGSTTLRRRLHQRGIEADECFWIANAHRLAGHRRLDLRVDPPPDLAIEIEVSRSSLKRMAIYATLGVPEVWRLDGDTLTFNVLVKDQSYEIAKVSKSFALVKPADLVGFLQQARQAADDNVVIRRFRKWIRQRRTASARE